MDASVGLRFGALTMVGAMALMVGTTAARPAAMPAAAAPTMLRARLNSDIASVDPGMKRDENTDGVLMHIVEGLVASRNDGSVAPMLARDWTISPDGRIYRFRLRHDVLFHNGRPMTSGEVVWSLRRYFDPAGHWRCKTDFGPKGMASIVSVRAEDRYTVTITLDHAAPMLLRDMARTDCGGTGIMHPASVGADGRMIRPIGTGPFSLLEWRRNQFVDLARFAAYRPVAQPSDGVAGFKRALVDRVRFEVIPDGSAASAALLRGSIDLIDGVAPGEVAAMAAQPSIRFSRAPTMDLYGVLFQTRDPVLGDVRIRRALALSLDVAALTRVAVHGEAVANSSPIPSASPCFQARDMPLIRQDLPRARALVKASEYHGQVIRLITNRRYPQAFDSAIILQAMARAIGLNVEIVTLDWAAQLARYAHGDYQMMLFPYSARLDPTLTLDPLTGSKAQDARKVWDDPAAIDLLARAKATGDARTRQGLFDEIDRLFRRDVPAIILFNSVKVSALRPNVTGYSNWAGATQRLWNVGLSNPELR